ncbi:MULTISPECIES: TenA family transcriptional regulator [Leptolyngbya]|jgi:pyrroloquinoline-quinone synthase|uniref:Cupin domain-containing protein n=1 Tax=Leptolyngbya boryana NIES-2135 TaxID=1973484 RepID=A0A1Z4JNP8_LEPBY|nr:MULTISPECIES: iron-containing redox enzyme family protein [Leptolyngbya]BAY58326.1 cupin domain-containing protein [Leptolyngbya boryana NIES-2135]MBD1857527.1 DUF3865 domain-containing protein [Leptolyngbya sp. FACHB-1624]MBD2368002.1 DUF3865 domain-containing protein [Leptolyngbya sp. FACHB-161]MBD2374526.1 DUF3865 domain-containing protein [Leptolyngbya sp. FACHB-238]MBD2398948.1 DUF3865 domain-containing protein [Leptolyngbya sp. FACHB-239]
MHNALPPFKRTILKFNREVGQSVVSIRQDLASVESGACEPPSTPAEARMALNQFMQSHPFWQNSLFQACRSGSLSQSDFQLIFAQYSLYSQNFTRYLAGLMANMEFDALRVKLIDNLWEESGGTNPDERHTEIFHQFLREGLNVDTSQIQYLDSTVLFVKEYLDFCLRSSASLSSAFLSLGTEAIVPRMYGIFVEGLLKAGIPETHLYFFKLHMEVDDAHAETLEEIMMAYSDKPYWFIQCQQSIDFALSLRMRFFEQLYLYIS